MHMASSFAGHDFITGKADSNPGWLAVVNFISAFCGGEYDSVYRLSFPLEDMRHFDFGGCRVFSNKHNKLGDMGEAQGWRAGPYHEIQKA